MRISDWSSDVCSSDLQAEDADQAGTWLQVDANGLRHDQGLRGHARPTQRTGPGMVPAARYHGGGAPGRQRNRNWTIGPDRHHDYTQYDFSQCWINTNMGDARTEERHVGK